MSTTKTAKILDLPNGGTLAADIIVGVQIYPQVTDSDLPLHVERVAILRRGQGGDVVQLIVYPNDCQAFAREAVALQRDPWIAE